MRAVVVYESCFGNTHTVAEAIARGLDADGEVPVIAVEEMTPTTLDDVDLVVCGGPTHVHGMTRASTRKGAADQAAASDGDLELDVHAAGPGLRDWFADLPTTTALAAAFDTRVHGPAMLTGRAAKGISHQLRHHGFDEVVEPESFLVTKENHLEPGEVVRATAWGRQVAEQAARSAEARP